ncbi:hypothetical protein CKN96_15800 [Carnobacterium maltaromaticum]|nr:hypothetical protein CKN96_15800 [Carnobacterium maltaromaticum]
MTQKVVFTVLQHPEILIIIFLLSLAGLIYCLISLINIYKEEREFRVRKYLNRRNWRDKR